MTDNELLLAISNMMDAKLEPVNNEIQGIKGELQGIKGEIRDLKAVAETDGPDSWPDPKKVCSPAKREAWTEV